MAKLVIVESPAKAKTIGKYLGDDYEVTASMGHIRDLPASQLGIDVEHDYAPQYISIKGKEKLIKELKSKAKHADGVLLATDPDREGEAISWHLANILGLDPHEPNRVTFDEITKKGVKEGMAHPRAIDEDLFNAQQARRVLDRLVGYKLSPFLWRKVRRGLSAGRVQSVAVRLIDDREKEIENFKPDEYWNVDATLGAGHKSFTARLATDSKGKKLLPKNEAEARAIEAGLQGAEYVVTELKKGKRAKQPTPAFITSTLQQEASRRLGFTATRTMRAAQTLYEGVDIAGHGTMGLITYMRTDSLRISDEAVAAAKEYIAGAYGEAYICPYKRTWKTKSATAAQDAHEAIRPSVPSLTPDEVDKSISGDTAKLYRMIWSRFMASQMADCQQDTVSVTVSAADYRFKASGYTVTFDGFTVLYEEATDEKEKKETALPPLEQGQVLKLRELKNIIIKYYPSGSSNELNGVLFDIFNCEHELASHNAVEDELFIPAVERLAAAGPRTVKPEPLSAREKEIIVCVVKGMTNKQIADALCISAHTVITHRRNIAAKLQIHSAAGLTIYAIVNKLVELNDVKNTIYSNEEQ